MRRSVGLIPQSINAASVKGLQRLMLKTQLKLGYGVTFFDIQFVNKKWHAWYYDNDVIGMHNVEAKLGTISERNEQG